MTEELKEQILEMVSPYPAENDSGEREKGYHEAVENFIRAFDRLIK